MEAKNSPVEWTVAGVLDELVKLHSSMPDRALAFVLGSGASVSSGIHTGKTMAENWLNELHLRECRDGSDRDQWIASGALGINDLQWDCAAQFYPQIFERRFGGDPESGFASLEAAMDDKEPSLGYSLLAEIMQHTRHKVVVTTNFDNLVADALAIHAHKPPLIVGHESLTGYVRSSLRRPLVAKIHRDLFLSPKNDPVGVDTLGKGWHEALTRLFKHYTPLVIGYGGNDGSLMGFLQNLKAGEICGRVFWCYRVGSPPSRAVCDLLLKHCGVMVAITSFDDFMLQMAAKLIPDFDMSVISTRIEERGKKRAGSYREQAERLQKNLVSNGAHNAEQQAARLVLADAFKDSNNWWAWEMRAKAESDPEKRDLIYREGLTALPGSFELLGNYANYLLDVRKDFDAAGAMYKKALALNPNDATNVGNYATLLRISGKDYLAAETMYKNALALDPNHTANIGNYANFLWVIRKDYDVAESMYRKTLELDPNAVKNIGNYATFLSDIRKDYDAAEAMYVKALMLDPNDATIAGNFANFLRNIRTDYAAAGGLYEKALALDPNHATNIGNYANVLKDDRKDYDTAEAMYKKALALDPNHAANIGNYANFLFTIRKDYDTAEAMYKRSLALDSNDANFFGNYASFLSDIRKDYDAAEEMFRKALAIDSNHAGHTGNFANFLRTVRRDYDAAEKMFKKALALDPNNAKNVGSYASFLSDIRKDYGTAEIMYKKALELDANDADLAANLACFQLIHSRFGPSLESAQRAVSLSGNAASQGLAEALFYLALINILEGRSTDHELGRLKSLLHTGYARSSWSFDALFESTLQKLSPSSRTLYQALGAAILDEQALVELEQNELWQQVEENPWFHS